MTTAQTTTNTTTTEEVITVAQTTTVPEATTTGAHVPTLMIDAQMIKGLTTEAAVEALMATKHTIKHMKHDIVALVGEGTFKATKRVEYAGMYVLAVQEYVAKANAGKPSMKDMKARINKLSKLMAYPITTAAKMAKVEWSEDASRHVVLEVLAKYEDSLVKRTELVEEIKDLGGKATIRNTYKELHNILFDIETKVIEAREEQEALAAKNATVAIPSTPAPEVVIPQQAPTKEEATMTKGQEPATMEYMNNALAAMMEAMTDASKIQLESTLEIKERLNEAAKYTKSLEAQINELKEKAPVVEIPKVRTAGEVIADLRMPKVEAPKEETLKVDLNEVVYTDDQIEMLQMIEKSLGKERAGVTKEAYRKLNLTMGRTVGGVLNGTARFMETKGHAGVDAASGIVAKTINSAKAIAISLIDISAITLHAANDIGTSAAHLIVDGTVYSLDAIASFNEKK